MTQDERKKAWVKFFRANPEFYALFKRFTFEAIESGQKIGARLIGERIRWERLVVLRQTDQYKVNNNHLPFYARLFMEDHPEHEGFFETRKRQCLAGQLV